MTQRPTASPATSRFDIRWDPIHPSAIKPGMFIRGSDVSGGYRHGIVDRDPSPRLYHPDQWSVFLRTETPPRLRELLASGDVEVGVIVPL